MSQIHENVKKLGKSVEINCMTLQFHKIFGYLVVNKLVKLPKLDCVTF